MTVLRRLPLAIGATVLGPMGALLFLEAAGIISGGWRHELASAISEAASPEWDLWVSAIVGLVLAALGMLMVLAQLTPKRRGFTIMYEVYDGSDGTTSIRGRAAIGAVQHELTAIEGVVDVQAHIVRGHIEVQVRVDDRANVATVEQQARSRIDHGFWINLGLADFTVDLLISHHSNSPRIR